MSLTGILSRRGSVVRAAVFRGSDLIHLDGDRLDRNPLCTRIYTGIVRRKEGSHYWVECPFGIGLLSQEKSLPALTVGQSVSVQIRREAFFDTAEQAFKSPLLTRQIGYEVSLWQLLIPEWMSLESLLVDDYEMMTWIKPYCQGVSYKVVSHNLFDAYGLEDTWSDLDNPKVYFPGGDLIIEETAAAVLIDINGSGKPEQLNQAAVPYLVNHLNWRTLSGSILIEFIDHAQGHRSEMVSYLRSALPEFRIHGFSKLGFLEVSRDKRRSPLHHRKVFVS